MKEDDVRDVYEEYFSDIEIPDVKDNDVQLQYILHFLGENKDIPILDAGCGTGRYALKLKKLGYNNLVAVDLFPEIGNREIVYQKASIENLPFEDQSFDFVYSNSVLYYLQNPKRGLTEINRCLKDNGYLVFSIHTKYSLHTLWRKIKIVFKHDSVKHLQGVRFYSVCEFEKMLNESGFDVLRKDGFDVPFLTKPLVSMIKSLLVRYFPNRVKRVESGNKYIALIKSIIAYHAIIIARKRT